jgi:DNA polymerase-3 subunit chi
MQVFFWGTDVAAGDPSWVVDWLLPHYEGKRRVCIVAASQEQAELLDEHLWQLPGERFVAHALADEASAAHAPVVIATQTDDVPGQASVWLNLGTKALLPFPKGKELHEQVASDKEHKEQAREKFRQYRSNGVQPVFSDWTGPRS